QQRREKIARTPGVYTFRGLIAYGYDNFTSVYKNALGSGDYWAFAREFVKATWVDFFLDSRSQANGTTCYFVGEGCANTSPPRLTSIRSTTNAGANLNPYGSSTPTVNECTTL